MSGLVRNPRVAICISGQMRTFRQAAASLMENLVQPSDADVFVHTWDVTGNTSKFILLIPAGFHLALPTNYWHAQPSLFASESTSFQRDFPRLHAACQAAAQADQAVVADEIEALYKPTRQVIEPLSSDIFKGIDLERLRHELYDTTALNAAPMFYKIHACDLLRQEHERATNQRYDIVVRTRPDIFFPQVVHFELLPGQLQTLYNPFYEIEGIQDRVANDMFWIGDSNTMSYAANLWNKLAEYWSPAFDPTWSMGERGAETILRKHLRIAGLDGQTFRQEPGPTRTTNAVSFPDLLEMLNADYLERGDLPTFTAKCVAYCQSLYSVDLLHLGRGEESAQILESAIRFGDFICDEPFVGRAKAASIRGAQKDVDTWLNLAIQHDQTRAFPDLFGDRKPG